MICDWCGDALWPGEGHTALIETPAGRRRETICRECWEEITDEDDEYPYGDEGEDDGEHDA